MAIVDNSGTFWYAAQSGCMCRHKAHKRHFKFFLLFFSTLQIIKAGDRTCLFITALLGVVSWEGSRTGVKKKLLLQTTCSGDPVFLVDDG
jgi:hypothetical protein